MSVDEDSYYDQYKPLPGNPQGSPHPIAWYRDGQAVLHANMLRPWTRISNTSWDTTGMFRPPGRMFYTGLGHREETWRDETFQSHIQGGIDWVLGVNTTKAKAIAPAASDNSTRQDDAVEKGSASTAIIVPGSRLGQSAIFGLVASTLLLHLAVTF